MIDVKEVPGQGPDLIKEKGMALQIFENFEKLMMPFMELFPSGTINWDKSGICSEFSFDWEFERKGGSYIRFTEEIKKEDITND